MSDCVNESSFVKAQKHLSEFEEKSTQLTLAIQLQKNRVENALSELNKAKSELSEASTHYAKISQELTETENEKARLLLDSSKATEDISLLNRQLTLLDTAIADIQRNMEEDKKRFAFELQNLYSRLAYFDVHQSPSSCTSY